MKSRKNAYAEYFPQMCKESKRERVKKKVKEKEKESYQPF
jgi:hypothetical protein